VFERLKTTAPDEPVRCLHYHSRIEPSLFCSPFFAVAVPPLGAPVPDAFLRRIKTEAADCYETTRRHIVEYLHSHTHHDDNFRFHVTRLILRMFYFIVMSLSYQKPKSARLASAYTNENTVAYLLKARIVEPEKQPLIGKGCITRKNVVTFGSGVFCAVRAGLYNEDQLPFHRSLGTAVRRVGGWCEMAASLRGREPRSRGTSTGEDTAAISLYSTLYTVQTSNTPCPHASCKVH
jgi:hypothetical protein